jgi:hypothetical protein
VNPYAQFIFWKYININVGFIFAFEIYYHKKYSFPSEVETTKGNINIKPMVSLGVKF